MRILHVCADYKWTGPAEPMLHAVRGLRARGHDVDLACAVPPPDEPNPQLVDNARERGIEPVLCLAPRRGFRPWRDRAEQRRIRELIGDTRYDVVHVHHTRDHLLVRWAQRGLGGRLVASWHHGDPVPLTPWNRLLLGPVGTDGLAVLTDTLAARSIKSLGFVENRVAAIPGAVDVDRFSPREPSAAQRSKYGVPDDARVVGVVARLQPHRRFELILDAFARARQHAPELRLLVLGRGTRAKQVLHDPVKALALEDAVIHAGHQREEFVDVMSLLDVLVFLVPGSDGSCRALLEAMSMATPGMVSSRGVLPDTVEDERTGRVIEEEPERFAKVLREFAHEPERWRAYGKAAREKILAQHSIDVVSEKLEAFYDGLIQ